MPQVPYTPVLNLHLFKHIKFLLVQYFILSPIAIKVRKSKVASPRYSGIFSQSETIGILEFQSGVPISKNKPHKNVF